MCPGVSPSSQFISELHPPKKEHGTLFGRRREG